MKSTGDLLNTTFTGIKRSLFFNSFFYPTISNEIHLGMFPCIQDQQITLPEAAESDEGRKTWIRVTVWLSHLSLHGEWAFLTLNVGTRLHMSCLDDQETSCEVSCLEMSITLDIIVGLIRFCYILYFYLWYAIIADSPLINDFSASGTKW